MKTHGRKRSPDAELLLAQIKDEFGEQKVKLGARRAARELGVCLASFYNYVNGVDLPGMEVLRTANQRWGIKWKLIDPSDILPKRKVKSPEQYVFSFLDALREQDVKVVRIGPKAYNVLEVTLKIRFSA